MKARRFVDTNILLYSISRDPGEAAKRDRATALLDAGDLAPSAQVMREFHVQAPRANRADALPHDITAGLIRAWTRFPIQEVSLGIVTAAVEVRATRSFSYRDCAIIAAARALGCRELLSEDMSRGQQIDDVTIVNPFRW